MADEDLRALAQRFAETGAPDDEAKLVAARLRAGVLGEDRVRLAARLGSAAAREVLPDVEPVALPRLGRDVDPRQVGRDDDVSDWCDRVVAPLQDWVDFGVEACARGAVAAARWFVVPIVGLDESQVVTAMRTPDPIDDEELEDLEPDEVAEYLETAYRYYGPVIEQPLRALIVAERAILDPSEACLSDVSHWAEIDSKHLYRPAQEAQVPHLAQATEISQAAAQTAGAEGTAAQNAADLVKYPDAPDFVRERWQRPAIEIAVSRFVWVVRYGILSQGMIAPGLDAHAEAVFAAIRAEVVPWALGHGDPVRDRTGESS